MGSVIEKIESRLPRTGWKAKPAEATVGLLEAVEVRRAKTESGRNKSTDSSTVRHQQDGLARVSREEIIPNRSHPIIKAA
jgi:hypothetical protein